MGEPTINVQGPPLWRGVTADIVLEVVTDSPLEVAGIEIQIYGNDGWSYFGRLVGRDDNYRRYHLEDRHHFLGRALLQAGRHRFPFRLTPPAAMAPSHNSDPAYSELGVLVTIKKPRFWRTDLRRRFWLQVREPPPSRIARESATVRGMPVAPNDPYIELSLAATQLIAGERLLGSFAVFHVDDSKPQAVTLALVPQLELFSRRTDRRDGFPQAIKVPFPAGAAGEALPFQFILPPEITPTFHAESHALSWRFVAHLKTTTTAIPVVIYDRSAVSRVVPLVVIPAVADRSVAALFEQLESGWQRVAADEDHERVAAEREVGDSMLRLAYVYRGERGTFLVGRVTHHSLGLALSVTRSSLIQHVLGNDIEVEIAGWDRQHFVIARYADQARAMLRVAVPPLQKLDSTIVIWTDDQLTLERSIAGLERHDLIGMVENLMTATAAIEAARPAIGPPPGLEVDLDRWRALARHFEGQLVVGDLSITGRLGHVPVTLGLDFDDGAPPNATHLRATVGDREVTGAAARAISLSSARPSQDDHGAHAAVADLLRNWPPDFVDLEIEDGIVAARCVLSGSADPARARDLVHALAAVLTALDPGAGPYR